MSQPEPSSHWDHLAAELGAEVPTDQPAPAPPPVRPPASVRPPVLHKQRTAPPPVERAKADWGGIADQLGVEEFEPEALRPPPSPASAPASPLAASGEPTADLLSRDRLPRQGRPRSAVGESAEVGEPRHGGRRERFERRHDRPEGRRPRSEGRPQRPRDRGPERPAEPDQDADEAAQTSEAARASQAGPLPAPSGVERRVEGEPDRPRHRRRRRRRRKADDTAAVVAHDAEASDGGPEDEDRDGLDEAAPLEDALERLEADQDRDLETPAADSGADKASEEGGQGRRRRRRRRHRGGREEASGGTEPADETAARELIAEDEEADDEPQEEHLEQPSAPADEDNEVDEESGPEDKPSHRGIVSWEEAIGVIVSANLEARARNPGDRHGRPRRGRPRS